MALVEVFSWRGACVQPLLKAYKAYSIRSKYTMTFAELFKGRKIFYIKSNKLMTILLVIL